MQLHENFESASSTGELGLIVQLTAFSVASSLLLLAVPSVETISFSIFLAGHVFRPRFAAKLMLTTVVTWELTVTMVLGFSGIIFPFKLAAWTVVLLLGLLSRELRMRRTTEFMITGALAGLLWDLVVLLALPLSVGGEGTYPTLLLTSFALGVPFTVMHVIGNAAVFATIPVVLRGILPPLNHNYEELIAIEN